MLKINLKQLEAFVATAEFSSFTKASEELFLTQSTVSSHISALESTLGVRLIQRSARQRVMLTKEGERVYREAKDILDRCQTLQDLKNQTRSNHLVIGASSVPGQCLTPEILGDFLQTGRLLSFELGDRGAFRKIYLAWRKDALLSDPEQKFLEFVKARPMVTSEE